MVFPYSFGRMPCCLVAFILFLGWSQADPGGLEVTGKGNLGLLVTLLRDQGALSELLITLL